MPKVRAGGADRYVDRASVATETYRQGIQNPRQEWQAATVASAAVHAQATIKAVNEGRFAKGVQKSGQAYYAQKAAGIGADRFAPGVQAAKGDYSAGVAPYLQVIESTTLPARKPKGDPANIQRVAVLATALHTKKTSTT